MNRITQKDLQIRVDYINKVLGTPLKPYQDKIDPTEKRFMPNAGCYHLEFQNGYVQFVQMSKNYGQTSTRQLTSGTKREVYIFLSGFINGMDNFEKRL